jgi:hypothetical protein
MMLKTAAAFITLACVSQILGYWYALPGHIGEPSWSEHAQFHLVLGWIWVVGLNIAIIVLTWGPLQKRERWAFWTLLVVFIFAQGGHFFASLAVPAGRPSEWWYDYALGAQLAIFAIGLAVAWKALSRPTSP